MVERILLGQRIEQERPYVTRQLQDLFSLLPTDLDRRTQLFQTAILGSRAGDRRAERWRSTTPSRCSCERLRQTAGECRPGTAATCSRVSPPLQAAAGASQPARSQPATRSRSATSCAKRSFGEARKQLEEAARSGRRCRSKTATTRKRPTSTMTNGTELATPRQQARQLFRQVDKTQEWAENNYYQLPIEQQNADLVTVNAFWRDYARTTPGQPFYSQHLADASRNFTEMMFALAVLDLPFEPGKHETEFEGPKLKFAASRPSIVFHEEIKPAGEQERIRRSWSARTSSRPATAIRIVENEQVDKYVTEEFLVHTVYGCQMVVTNPTSSRQKLDVLLQIPLGALPVRNGQATRSVAIDLQPFATQTLEYYFYFPAPGKFTHYPVHVSKNGQLIAFAEPIVLNVRRRAEQDRHRVVGVRLAARDRRRGARRTSRSRTCYRVDLARIAFRMQRRQVLPADGRHPRRPARLQPRAVVVRRAAQRAAGDRRVPAARRSASWTNAGLYLKSPLLVIDPVARRTLPAPGVQAAGERPHAPVGQAAADRERPLLRAVHALAARAHATAATLSDDDLMAVTYYLLLQDRIEEGAGHVRRR